MGAKRVQPTPELKAAIDVASAHMCCIAGCDGPIDHLHHIDKDASNTVFENLAPLCHRHHDEAHTKRDLAQNLTAGKIKAHRDEWYARVERAADGGPAWQPRVGFSMRGVKNAKLHGNRSVGADTGFDLRDIENLDARDNVAE